MCQLSIFEFMAKRVVRFTDMYQWIELRWNNRLLNPSKAIVLNGEGDLNVMVTTLKKHFSFGMVFIGFDTESIQLKDKNDVIQKANKEFIDSWQSPYPQYKKALKQLLLHIQIVSPYNVTYIIPVNIIMREIWKTLYQFLTSPQVVIASFDVLDDLDKLSFAFGLPMHEFAMKDPIKVWKEDDMKLGSSCVLGVRYEIIQYRRYGVIDVKLKIDELKIPGQGSPTKDDFLQFGIYFKGASLKKVMHELLPYDLAGLAIDFLKFKNGTTLLQPITNPKHRMYMQLDAAGLLFCFFVLLRYGFTNELRLHLKLHITDMAMKDKIEGKMDAVYRELTKY